MSSVFKKKLRIIFFPDCLLPTAEFSMPPFFGKNLEKEWKKKCQIYERIWSQMTFFLLISFESFPHFPTLFWSLDPHFPLISWNLSPLSEPLEWFSSPNSFQSMLTAYPLLPGPLIKLASSTCTIRHTQDYTSDSILNYKQSIA